MPNNIMNDIVLETTGAFIAAMVFFTLLRAIRHDSVRSQPGTLLVVVGFGLVFLGMSIDITDNFPALNGFIVVGDTEVEAFIEKVIGALLGFLLLALGFRRWIPSIIKADEMREDLRQLNLELDRRIQERTGELRALNEHLTAEIVERKKAEDRLTHMALYDALTNLPNRYAITEFLAQEIARTRRHGYHSAILFFDLDNFKIINDSLGHEIGDLVLKAVAERLDGCRRTEDFLARLGGDEFLLVLTELDKDLQIAAERAQVSANRTIEALTKPLQIGEHKFSISTSIGIRIFTGSHTEDANDLLRQADTALYHAKNMGKAVSCFFQPEMQKWVEHRLILASELREALASNQLTLYYQPQVDGNGQVFGLEALVRWSHPARGMIGAGEFIPIAEEIGVIDELGRYVLHRACSEYRKLSRISTVQNSLIVSINISPKHFLQSDFVSQIEQIMNSYDLDHGCLVLEVTEGILINDCDDVSAKMNALRLLGVGFAMDDFGTGYSSLLYLKRLPLNALKIDRTFIRDIDTDPNDAAIVEATLAMSGSLGIDVIAEGVETERQYSFLKKRGCKLFQGYLFGRPAPADEVLNTGIYKPQSSTVSKNNNLRMVD